MCGPKGTEVIRVSTRVVFTVLLAPKLLAICGSPSLEASRTRRLNSRDHRRCGSTFWSYNENRTRRKSDHPLSNGSEQKVRNAAMAMRSHDEQVGFDVRSQLSNRLRGTAMTQMRGQMLNDGLFVSICGLTRQGQNFFHVSAELGRIVCSHVFICRCNFLCNCALSARWHILNRMNDVEMARPAQLSQGNCFGERKLTQFRIVHTNKDREDF